MLRSLNPSMAIKPWRLLTTPRASVVDRDVDGALATLRVDGLVCSLCARRVSSALERVDGVIEAECDLNSGTAVVRTRGSVNDDALTSAVTAAAIAMPVRRVLGWMSGR